MSERLHYCKCSPNYVSWITKNVIEQHFKILICNPLQSTIMLSISHNSFSYSAMYLFTTKFIITRQIYVIITSNIGMEHRLLHIK